MPGRVFTPQEVAAAMRRAGFPESVIQTGVAIAMAESSLRDDAVNDGSGTNSVEYSVGPWQINLKAHPHIKPAQAMDLQEATNYAYQLWQKQGWNPWGAYTDQRYLQFTNAAPAPGGTNMAGEDISKRLRKKPAVIRDSNGNEQFDIKPSSGGFIVRYEDGDYDFISNSAIFGNTIPPDEAARIQLGRDQLNLAVQKFQTDLANDASGRQFQQAQLAEQQRQFNERFGMDKAMHQERVGEDRRQFDERFGFDKAVFNARFPVEEAGVTGMYKGAPTLQRENFQEGQRQFDTNVIGRNADRDLSRGQTLLGLGSRPETLFRYLYGRQGLQTPEGIFDKLAPLPGFGPNAAAGATDPKQNPQPLPRAAAPVPAPVAAATPEAAGPAAPPPVVPPVVPPVTNGMSILRQSANDPLHLSRDVASAAEAAQLRAANVTDIQRNQLAVGGLPGGQIGFMAEQAPAFESRIRDMLRGNFDRDLASGLIDRSRYDAEKKRIGFAKGGPIPEPVIGQGLISGQSYSFGEEGPEYVIPTDQLDSGGEPTTPRGDGDIWEKVGKLLKGLLDDSTTKTVREARHRGSLGQLLKNGIAPRGGMLDKFQQRSRETEDINRATNSYAGGGLIGFQHRTSDRNTFMPESLGTFADQQFLPGGVPNLPQLKQFTGGTSLLPSAQRISQSTPTERAAYGGMANDVFGIPQADIWDLAQRLAPQSGRVRTPRYR